MARISNFSIIDKLGKNIDEAVSLDEALTKSGLNWKAKESPTQYTVDDGTLRTNPYHRTLFRSDNGDFLGIVGQKYTVLQNDEAFAMAESLLGDMTFVKGGQFGSQTSITMRAPDSEIEGDVIKNYVSFRNSFDGSSKVQFVHIPVRQVCENGLCVETPGQKRVFELPHLGDIDRKYQELFVRNSLGNAEEAIKTYAQKLLKIKVGRFAFTEILDKFFPVNIDGQDPIVSSRKNTKNLEARAELAAAFDQEDLANFNGTAYKVFQAFCDYETHSAGVVSQKPEIAQRQQFLRAFGGFGLTLQVMNYLANRA